MNLFKYFRTLLSVVLALVMAVSMVSCNDEVSYSDMKKKEGRAINEFISKNGIDVVTLAEFTANGSVTDCSKNEYVRVGEVYMQIVNNPKDVPGAKKLDEGTSLNLLVTFSEYNIMDDEEVTNNLSEAEPDVMTVKNNEGSYEASFLSGVMQSLYSTTAVPTGWLAAMPYLSFVRNQSNLAEVNLIVPHTSGTSIAATYVYPCFYNIKFQPE